MYRIAEFYSWRRALVASVIAMTAGGCSSGPATLELIAAARVGLSQARETQQAQHEQLLAQLSGQASALDAAFDADVRLAESGALKDAGGQPIALDAQWVISARKGYAAARDALAAQISRQNSAHASAADNLAASDEMLELASQLVLEQSRLSQQVRRSVLGFQRSLTNGK